MDTNKPIVIEGWASSYSKIDEGYYFAPGEPILSHQRPATLVINDKAILESTVKEMLLHILSGSRESYPNGVRTTSVSVEHIGQAFKAHGIEIETPF